MKTNTILEKTRKVMLGVMATFILCTSCASTTLITTNHDNNGGAAIYIDGASVGKTPYSMTDTKIVGSVTTLSLKKEGCETLNTTISRSEKADIGAIIGGLFVWIPFLWTMGYNPIHHYELEPNQIAD